MPDELHVFAERTSERLDDAGVNPLSGTAMSKPDDAFAALESRNWSDAQHDRPRSPSVVQSVRFSLELTERLVAESQRRGVTPSEVIRDLVEAGLTAAEESATVRLADVQWAINMLARSAVS
ncbi:hypothetical protein [Dactylosporangium sp. NPDC051484]|uniref:hypothetical protein n=1 Tax=Dactylosporangium sp. NPDC051484 TaxID=3154942 RepID=UPI0034505C82